MSPKHPFSTENLRLDILEFRENLAVEILLSDYARRFAVYGLLDVALILVSLLNQYNPTYTQPHRHALWFAWKELDKWPEGEFEKVDESWHHTAQQKLQDLSIENQYDNLGDADELNQLLKDVAESDSTTLDCSKRLPAEQVSSALVKALDLSSRLFPDDWQGNDVPSERKTQFLSPVTKSGELEAVAFTTAILACIGNRILARHQLERLAHSPRAWKILKTGALAKASGIEMADLEQRARIIEETFRQRLTLGPQRSNSSQTMLEVLETSSNNTIHGEGAKERRLQAGWEAPETLFRDGASNEEIAELESRLGVQLPPALKEFLSLSNGFGAPWDGCFFDVPLHSSKAIRWLRDDETYFFDLRLDLLEESPFYFLHDFDAELRQAWPRVGRAIEIGSEDIENVWLLPPERVSEIRNFYLKILDHPALPEERKKHILNVMFDFCAGREAFEALDWCVVTWASGGVAAMWAFPSFKAYLYDRATASERQFTEYEED